MERLWFARRYLAAITVPVLCKQTLIRAAKSHGWAFCFSALSARARGYMGRITVKRLKDEGFLVQGDRVKSVFTLRTYALPEKRLTIHRLIAFLAKLDDLCEPLRRIDVD